MPHCLICSARFHGPGGYCTLHRSNLHRSRTRERYNYSSDSSHPGETYFRTSQGTAGVIPRRRPRYHDGYNDVRALALYNSDCDSRTMTATLANTLSQSFTTLQDTHVIASLTYSVTPDGTQTITAEANLEREQCLVCCTWFPNHEKLEYHHWESPVGCEAHGVCMRTEDALWHGTSERHDRCFVRNCESVYRREGGWRSGVIERHIKGRHR